MTAAPITVLMGVYNAQDYLREAVDSILHQTFSDFEFLVINDGSSDRSAEILATYTDPRLKIVHNPGNLGLIETLNRGLEMISSKYIVRMDADDVALPRRLSKLYHFMEKHPDIGVCGSTIRHFGTKNLVWAPPRTSEGIRIRLLWDNALAHPSVILRRDFLQKHHLRYDPAFPHCEDYRLWVECAQRFPLHNISNVLLHYRVHPEQASSVHRKEQTQSLCKVMMSYLSDELHIQLADQRSHPHMALSRCYKLDDPQALQSVGEWADYLLQKNRDEKAFEARAFARQVCKRWFRICLRSGVKRSVMRQIFFSSTAGRGCYWYEKFYLFLPRRLNRKKIYEMGDQ